MVKHKITSMANQWKWRVNGLILASVKRSQAIAGDVFWGEEWLLLSMEKWGVSDAICSKQVAR